MKKQLKKITLAALAVAMMAFPAAGAMADILVECWGENGSSYSSQTFTTAGAALGYAAACNINGGSAIIWLDPPKK